MKLNQWMKKRTMILKRKKFRDIILLSVLHSLAVSCRIS